MNKQYYNKDQKRYRRLKKALLHSDIDIEKAFITKTFFNQEFNEFLIKQKIHTTKDLLLINEDELFSRNCYSAKQLKEINSYLDRFKKEYNLNLSDSQSVLSDTFKLLESAPNSFLQKDIDFSSSARLENALKKRYRIVTFYDLRNYGLISLTKIQNIGKKSWVELNKIVKNSLNNFANKTKC
ncbi:MAG: hypothetical protein K6E11_00065 [Bacilli bacterium]|nr:hypothetical protein [Bacilli bacterium]